MVEMHVERSEEYNRATDRAGIDQTGRVLSFLRTPPSQRNCEVPTAVDLVYQAADMIKIMQDRTEQFESQAEEMIRRACEKLQFAEARIQALEAEQSASEGDLNEARAQILDCERELQRAQSRFA